MVLKMYDSDKKNKQKNGNSVWSKISFKVLVF